MNENDKQAEPVAQPYAHIYEFDSAVFGTHRSFSPSQWNGMKPTRTVAVYTHPATAVAQEPVVQRTLGYEQGIQDAAKMLDTKANDYAKEFGFDDMGALEFSREAQREYHSTLVELAEEVRSMEATNKAPAVAQPPAEVVRELVGALKCVVGWSQSPNRYIPDTCIDQVKAALKSAKEHGL